MQKDVEFTFGIMKGRQQIIKAVIYLHSTASVGLIQFTCYAFYNMLLKINGLHESWSSVKVLTMNWDGHLDNLDNKFVELIPTAICRTILPAPLQDYASTDLGATNQNCRLVQMGTGDIDLKEKRDLSHTLRSAPGDKETCLVQNLNHFLSGGAAR